MRMSIKLMTFILVLTSLQSCTVFFPVQRIKAESSVPNVALTINGQSVVEGDKLFVRRKRPVVIAGYRYGYRTRSEMMYPKRINSALLFTGTFLGFGLALGDPTSIAMWGSLFAVDLAVSPKKHRKTYTLGELEPLPKNPTPNLRVWGDYGLSKVPIESFEILSFKKPKKFEKSLNGISQEISSRDRIDSLNIGYHIDGMLETMGYQEEAAELFTSYETNLYLDADIRRLIRYELNTVGHRHMVEMTWKVLDIYGKELYSLPVTAESQVFSVSNDVSEGIEDALYMALVQLLSDDGFKEVQAKVFSLQENEFASLSDIELPGGSAKLSLKPSDMVHSQVSLLTENSHGSACVISPEGHILASYSMVEQEEELEVQFSNGAKKWASVLRKDPITNVVLLKVDTTGVAFVRPSIVSDYRVGDEVVAISSPVSTKLAQSYSTGIISAERNSNGVNYIQTDVKVSVGANGSPLINGNGELIGLIVEKKFGSGIEGLSFAVASSNFMNRLKIKYGK